VKWKFKRSGKAITKDDLEKAKEEFFKKGGTVKKLENKELELNKIPSSTAAGISMDSSIIHASRESYISKNHYF